MPPKGYTDVQFVRLFLGRELTAADLLQAERLLDPAEALCDAISRRSWLTGPIVAEPYSLINVGIKVHLRQYPVQSVEAVTARSLQVGDAGVALAAGKDYELVDPAAGLLALSGTWSTAAYYNTYQNYGGSAIYSEGGTLLNQGQFSSQLLLVSYTPVQAVPYVVQQAAAELVAHWLLYRIDPARYGVSSARTADEAVTFAPATIAALVPPGVYELLQRGVATLYL